MMFSSVISNIGKYNRNQYNNRLKEIAIFTPALLRCKAFIIVIS